MKQFQKIYLFRILPCILFFGSFILSQTHIPADPYYEFAVTGINFNLSKYYVSTWGSDSNIGTENDPLFTIQAGIDAAENGDTVFVQAGTYMENINFNGKNIVVQGEYEETTIIDGNRLDRVLSIDGGTSNISNFTFTNGYAHVPGTTGRGDDGGGLHIENGSLVLNNSIIRDNEAADWGGAISSIQNEF